MDRPVPQCHFDGEEFRPFTYEDLLTLLETVRDTKPGPRYLDLPPEVPPEYWPMEFRLIPDHLNRLVWEVAMGGYANAFPQRYTYGGGPDGE